MDRAGDAETADLRELIELVRGVTYQFRRSPTGEYCLTQMSDAVHDLVDLPRDVDLMDFSAWTRYIPERYLGPFLESIEQSARNMTTWTHEWPMETNRGRIWLQAISRPHEDGEGGVVWNGLMFDVTDRHVIAAQLDQAETNYHSVFENANEGIFRSTPEGRLLDVNTALVRMHRCRSKHELLSVGDVTQEWYVRPEDRHQLLERLEADGAIDGYQVEIYRIGTGERFMAEENATAVRDANGNTLYYQGTIQDITDDYRRRQIDRRRGEVLEQIARGELLTDIVYDIVAALEDFGERITAAIFRLDKGRVQVLAAPGLDNACIAAIRNRAPRSVGGALAAALKASVPTRQSRQATSGRSRLARAMRHAGYADLVALPVRARDGEILGFIAAFTADTSPASADLRKLLHELAQITSIALEQDQLTRSLVEQAQYDSLTQLPNRVLLADRVQQLIHDAERSDTAVGMLLLDLDEFKVINDTLGHQAGDDLLRQVARRLETCVRSSDTVVRFGGDEFIVVVPLDKVERASEIAERILAALTASFAVGGNNVMSRPSIGISLYPQDGQSLETLLQAADTAMYAAKQAGKNQYRYFDEAMNAEVSERLRIEGELREAIAGNELEPWYQPRIRLRDRTPCAIEALLRWHHPRRGLLLPGEFLHVAERSDLITDVDAFTLGNIVDRISAWPFAGRRLPVAINLSVRQLQREDFASEMAAALGQLGEMPGAVELEITESMALQHFDQVIAKLQDLRTRAPGVRVALDDFGKGYSSLQYLARLPIDILKIDRLFIEPLDDPDKEGVRARAIARTVIELGENLGLDIVAEGVETEEQARILVELGCPEAQGFLFAHPMPAADLSAWFASVIPAARPSTG